MKQTESLAAAETVQYRRPEIYMLRNVHLVGPRATCITRSRKIITEHLGGTRSAMLSNEPNLRPFLFLTKSLGRPEQKLDRVFSINSRYAFNFYHWFMDCLTCLRGYEEYRTDRVCDLMLPAGLSAWQRRSLELMSYKEGYIPYEFNHLFVRELVLPSWPRVETFDLPPSPSTLSWLRNRLMENHRPGCSVDGDRIFISREDSSKGSRIANESEVRKLLTDLGFETVVLSEMSLDEQISLFEKAKFVVASHGAGLTNLLYSSNPRVVEIFPKNEFNRYYSSLTRFSNGQYVALFAETPGENGNWSINVKLLNEAIDRLFHSNGLQNEFQ
jgi:capsular polysaccharide biosynthesis protein